MLWVLNRIASLHINICCGYSLESPQRGDSNEYPQHINICCGYSLESPQRGDSNGYPQHMFFWRNNKNYPLIILKYPPYLFHWYSSTSHENDIGKQCGPRSDIGKWGVWSGSTPFAMNIGSRHLCSPYIIDPRIIEKGVKKAVMVSSL